MLDHWNWHSLPLKFGANDIDKETCFTLISFEVLALASLMVFQHRISLSIVVVVASYLLWIYT